MSEVEAPVFPAELPDHTREAWQAYHTMVASKMRHFDFLSMLNQKYEAGGRRTLAEIAHLDQLLAAHTTAVKAFGSAIATLGRGDTGARDALLAHLHALNASLGVEPGPTH